MRPVPILVTLWATLALVLAACAPATPTPAILTPSVIGTPVAAPTPGATPTPGPAPTPVAAPSLAAVPVPGAGANFRLLISDERNAIGDFKSLVITISRIGVLLATPPTPTRTPVPTPAASPTPTSTPTPTPTPTPGEGQARWFEFVPEVTQVDLVPLQGENALEVWGGQVPEGRYLKVFIYVDSAEGTLKNGKKVEVKLPSGKLQISKPFEVKAGSPANFVFDLTVIPAGSEKARGGIKYILLPQVAQSGGQQSFREVKSEAARLAKEKAKGKLHLALDGEAKPGAGAVLSVTVQGQPAAGATVTLNGTSLGTTDAQGRLSLTIPRDVEEVEIKAQLGKQEGELELKLVEKRAKQPQRQFRGTITAITQGTPSNSPWTMSIPGVGEAVSVVLSAAEEIEGTPQVGATAKVKGVLEEGVIYAGEAEIEGERKKPEKMGKLELPSPWWSAPLGLLLPG